MLASNTRRREILETKIKELCKTNPREKRQPPAPETKDVEIPEAALEVPAASDKSDDELP